MFNNIFKYDPTYMINDPLIDTKLKDLILNYPKKYRIENIYNRLDILSYKLYNTVDYWYILALYNAVENPFDISMYEYMYYIPKSDLQDIFNQI